MRFFMDHWLFLTALALLTIVYNYYPRTPKPINDQVILITGGAQGLGKLLSTKFALLHRNVTLIIFDIQPLMGRETGKSHFYLDFYNFLTYF